MNVIVPERRYTPEDLLSMSHGPRFELIDGRLVEKPMGARSALVVQNVNRTLDNHALAHQLGRVYPSNCGYQCFPWAPSHVRLPDGSFVRKGRLPNDEPPDGHMRIAPDLAHEVVSPNDLAEEIEERVSDLLRAGVSLVWVFYPRSRNVYVYRQGGGAQRLTAADELSGEDVLPGFRCRVEDLFAGA